ncbi:MAG TPA: LacI family transcriptional regulator [Treponema sp.]|nr:LacI family transcriptional regulator [Treponema sp.]
MRLSIHDVAREASLSCETILEVLTSPSSLEPEVVRFVMQTIRKSGYLDTFLPWKKRSDPSSIAILTAGVDSASTTEIFKGIDRVMQSLGLATSTLIFPTRVSPKGREDLLDNLLRFRMISAVLMVNLTPTVEMVQKYSSLGKPLVLIQTTVPGAQSVLLENQKGMAIAVNYLFRAGHRRIALINGTAAGREPGVIASERLMGYVNALQRLGLEFEESLVFEVKDYFSEEGAKGFEYFSSQDELPDAVICGSGDMSALGFIEAARQHGLRIPDDIAVMGYDDLPIARLVHPGLTTIRQRLMIAGAGGLVLALEAAANGTGQNLVIMPELIERGSA